MVPQRYGPGVLGFSKGRLAKEPIVLAGAAALARGLDPLIFIDERDEMTVAVLSRIIESATIIAAEEREDLATRIANAVSKMLGG